MDDVAPPPAPHEVPLSGKHVNVTQVPLCCLDLSLTTFPQSVTRQPVLLHQTVVKNGSTIPEIFVFFFSRLRSVPKFSTPPCKRDSCVESTPGSSQVLVECLSSLGEREAAWPANRGAHTVHLESIGRSRLGHVMSTCELD